jgi:polyisoprenoid-binding protein YceI
MRVTGSCKLRVLGAGLLALLLGGCALRPPLPAPAAGAAATLAPHEGTPHDIVAAESLLTIRAYRGGTLASAGHNHLIAAHALSGTIYVPANLMRTSFEVRLPVAELTVDEAALREQEHSGDFPPQVPDSAREGTRHNMLGEALLDGEHYPQIVLRAVRLEPAAAGADGATVLAHIEATVRGQVHTLRVPVTYQLGAGEVTVAGETTLRQSELGLTPFSALLGALQVQDEMRIRFRIVARAAAGAAPR